MWSPLAALLRAAFPLPTVVPAGAWQAAALLKKEIVLCGLVYSWLCKSQMEHTWMCTQVCTWERVPATPIMRMRSANWVLSKWKRAFKKYCIVFVDRSVITEGFAIERSYEQCWFYLFNWLISTLWSGKHGKVNMLWTRLSSDGIQDRVRFETVMEMLEMYQQRSLGCPFSKTTEERDNCCLWECQAADTKVVIQDNYRRCISTLIIMCHVSVLNSMLCSNFREGAKDQRYLVLIKETRSLMDGILLKICTCFAGSVSIWSFCPFSIGCTEASASSGSGKLSCRKILMYTTATIDAPAPICKSSHLLQWCPAKQANQEHLVGSYDFRTNPTLSWRWWPEPEISAQYWRWNEQLKCHRRQRLRSGPKALRTPMPFVPVEHCLPVHPQHTHPRLNREEM